MIVKEIDKEEVKVCVVCKDPEESGLEESASIEIEFLKGLSVCLCSYHAEDLGYKLVEATETP